MPRSKSKTTNSGKTAKTTLRRNVLSKTNNEAGPAQPKKNNEKSFFSTQLPLYPPVVIPAQNSVEELFVHSSKTTSDFASMICSRLHNITSIPFSRIACKRLSLCENQTLTSSRPAPYVGIPVDVEMWHFFNPGLPTDITEVKECPAALARIMHDFPRDAVFLDSYFRDVQYTLRPNAERQFIGLKLIESKLAPRDIVQMVSCVSHFDLVSEFASPKVANSTAITRLKIINFFKTRATIKEVIDLISSIPEDKAGGFGKTRRSLISFMASALIVLEAEEKQTIGFCMREEDYDDDEEVDDRENEEHKNNVNTVEKTEKSNKKVEKKGRVTRILERVTSIPPEKSPTPEIYEHEKNEKIPLFNSEGLRYYRIRSPCIPDDGDEPWLEYKRINSHQNVAEMWRDLWQCYRLSFLCLISGEMFSKVLVARQVAPEDQLYDFHTKKPIPSMAIILLPLVSVCCRNCGSLHVKYRCTLCLKGTFCSEQCSKECQDVHFIDCIDELFDNEANNQYYRKLFQLVKLVNENPVNEKFANFSTVVSPIIATTKQKMHEQQQKEDDEKEQKEEKEEEEQETQQTKSTKSCSLNVEQFEKYSSITDDILSSTSSGLSPPKDSDISPFILDQLSSLIISENVTNGLAQMKKMGLVIQDEYATPFHRKKAISEDVPMDENLSREPLTQLEKRDMEQLKKAVISKCADLGNARRHALRANGCECGDCIKPLSETVLRQKLILAQRAKAAIAKQLEETRADLQRVQQANMIRILELKQLADNAKLEQYTLEEKEIIKIQSQRKAQKQVDAYVRTGSGKKKKTNSVSKSSSCVPGLAPKLPKRSLFPVPLPSFSSRPQTPLTESPLANETMNQISKMLDNIKSYISEEHANVVDQDQNFVALAAAEKQPEPLVYTDICDLSELDDDFRSSDLYAVD